jgi:hypothetical protein
MKTFLVAFLKSSQVLSHGLNEWAMNDYADKFLKDHPEFASQFKQSPEVVSDEDLPEKCIHGYSDDKFCDEIGKCKWCLDRLSYPAPQPVKETEPDFEWVKLLKPTYKAKDGTIKSGINFRNDTSIPVYYAPKSDLFEQSEQSQQASELEKVQAELIKFYGNYIDKVTPYLVMHKMGATREEVEKGKELRNRISELTKK